jgi:DNA-binding PadR family transcriptional regulator
MPRSPNSSDQTKRLLAALLGQAETWRYGYDLSKETVLKSGTLYPILMRLEGQGLLETCWEDPPVPGRPPRHLYRLTTSGRAAATEASLSVRADGKQAAKLRVATEAN